MDSFGYRGGRPASCLALVTGCRSARENTSFWAVFNLSWSSKSDNQGEWDSSPVTSPPRACLLRQRQNSARGDSCLGQPLQLADLFMSSSSFPVARCTHQGPRGWAAGREGSVAENGQETGQFRSVVAGGYRSDRKGMWQERGRRNVCQSRREAVCLAGYMERSFLSYAVSWFPHVILDQRLPPREEGGPGLYLLSW